MLPLFAYYRRQNLDNTCISIFSFIYLDLRAWTDFTVPLKIKIISEIVESLTLQSETVKKFQQAKAKNL